MGAAVEVAVQGDRHALVRPGRRPRVPPSGIPARLAPVLAGRTDHVLGSRIFGMNTCFRSFKFAISGHLLTLAADLLLYNSCLADIQTGLNLVPLGSFRALTLFENGFELDTEITARLLRGGVHLFEIPINYHERSVEQGKKISWRDGTKCVLIPARVRFQREIHALSPPQVIIQLSTVPVASWCVPGQRDSSSAAEPGEVAMVRTMAI
jgi:hypothetical protein